jgi:hypothetical protein
MISMSGTGRKFIGQLCSPADSIHSICKTHKDSELKGTMSRDRGQDEPIEQ